jgi:hypothetical protein
VIPLVYDELHRMALRSQKVSVREDRGQLVLSTPTEMPSDTASGANRDRIALGWQTLLK